MATYCFQCVNGHYFEAGDRETVLCPGCGAETRRDYGAEGVGFNGIAEMRRQREQGLDGLSGRKAQRDLFLPTADELRTRSDPSGQKGIRDWAERHGPRDTNKKPLYPDMEKRTF